LFRVAVILELVRGAGLTRDAISRDLRFRGGASGTDRLLEHVPHGECGGVADDGLPLDGTVALEQGCRHELAAACEDRVSSRELHQVHRNAVTESHRRLLDRLPCLCGAELPGDLAWEAGVGRRAEPGFGEHLPESG